jgi:hypothetical protein
VKLIKAVKNVTEAKKKREFTELQGTNGKKERKETL